MYMNDNCVNNPEILNQAVEAIRQDREGIIGLMNGGLKIPVLSIHCLVGLVSVYISKEYGMDSDRGWSWGPGVGS